MMGVEQRRLREVAVRVVSRLQSSALMGAMERWVEYWQEIARLKRIGSRLHRLAESRAFVRWVEAVIVVCEERKEAAHAEAVAAMREQARLQEEAHAAAMASQGEASQAEKDAAEARHAETMATLRASVVAKVVARMQRRAMSAAWGAWAMMGVCL